MASFTASLSNPASPLLQTSTTTATRACGPRSFTSRGLYFAAPRPSCQSLQGTRSRSSAGVLVTRAMAGAPSAAAGKKANHERVRRVRSIEEFDAALHAAKNRLVVVEFAASDSDQSNQIYPFMVELSRTCADVDFLLVMEDESEATRALCEREKIDKVPHFSFYKGMEKIHEEEGDSLKLALVTMIENS